MHFGVETHRFRCTTLCATHVSCSMRRSLATCSTNTVRECSDMHTTLTRTCATTMHRHCSLTTQSNSHTQSCRHTHTSMRNTCSLRHLPSRLPSSEGAVRHTERWHTYLSSLVASSTVRKPAKRVRQCHAMPGGWAEEGREAQSRCHKHREMLVGHLQ